MIAACDTKVFLNGENSRGVRGVSLYAFHDSLWLAKVTRFKAGEYGRWLVVDGGLVEVEETYKVESAVIQNGSQIVKLTGPVNVWEATWINDPEKGDDESQGE